MFFAGFSLIEALEKLSEDEVEHRAQQVALALQSDFETLGKRVECRKRHRYQVEQNFENEIEQMRVALAVRSLSYFRMRIILKIFRLFYLGMYFFSLVLIQ